MKKEKIFSLGLIFLLVLSLFGCAGKETDENKEGDPNTLTITLGVRNVEQLIEGLTAQFPDIHFIIEPTYCSNQSSYLRQMLLTDNTSDIFYYSQRPVGTEAAKHLLDLSGYDFISNFDRSVINTYLVDGRIYTIPGPMALRGMAYNKTLFEEHGWRKPENHQELVQLCKQIRAETDDITPISMSFGGVAYPFTIVTTLSQAGFLGTPDGEEWEKRFLAGEASIAEGWGEGLEMTAQLIDAGAFHAEPYIGVWDGDACNMEFAHGKAAMFAMLGGQSALLEMMESNPDYEFAFMPFYGMKPGEMTICANPNLVWGIPKRLGEPGNEKKLENALRVMEWFSTPQAQDLMKSFVIDENGNAVPSMAEMSPLNTEDNVIHSSHYFAELWHLADRGHKTPMIYSGYESVIVNAGTIVQDAMLAGTSEGMIEQFVSSVDTDYQNHLSGGDEAVLTEITQDFTKEETAQILVNALNDSGLGDFALITRTGRAGKGIDNKCGAGARCLKGPLTNQNYNTILGEIKNVQTLTLTGARIKKLLSDGKRIYSSYDPSQFADFPYYWAGIDVELSGDGSIKSVKLDGGELEDSKAYKVVFCNKDYTEELAADGNPVDTGISLADLWMDYISEHETISPPEVLRK